MKFLTALLVVSAISFASGAENTASIAAHNPKVQKAKKDYRSATGDAFLRAYEAILKLQKRHRSIFDELKVGMYKDFILHQQLYLTQLI